MRTGWVAALAAATLVLVACSSSANDNPTIGGGVGQIADVTLQAVNGGQSGTATVTESPSLVMTVTVKLDNAPQGAQQPAGVHAGTCAIYDPKAKFGLNTVVSGTSSSSALNTTLGELQSSPYVIVVERAPGDTTAVSCGPIPQVSPSAT